MVGSIGFYDETFMRLQKTAAPTLSGEFCEEFIPVCKLRVKVLFKACLSTDLYVQPSSLSEKLSVYNRSNKYDNFSRHATLIM